MSMLRRVARAGYCFSGLLLLGVLFPVQYAQSEDIDIFASALTSSAAEASRPNIIIMLDNTSNWSGNNQQFPSATVDFNGNGYTAGVMGEFELAAIQTALETVESNGPFNISLMSFTTDGTANQNGGLTRFDLRYYQGDETEYDGSSTVKAGLENMLETAFTGVRTPSEKRNSNTEFGYLAYDVYNYLSGGNQSWNGAGTLASLADEEAYTSNYDQFESPLDEDAVCANTYLIWVGNPNQNGPARDDAANSTILRALYVAEGGSAAALAEDSTGAGILMPEYENLASGGGASTESKGYTGVCFEKRQDCNTAVDPADATANPSLGSEILSACATAGDCTCSNTSPLTTKPDGSACGSNGRKQLYSYDVQGPVTGGEYRRSGDTIDGKDYNFDDWTRFFYEYGIPVPGTDVRTRVTTFTVDVFDKQPDEEFSALLDSAASVGGGYRVAANDYSELVAAFQQIFGDILAVNANFSAVTLPLSASERSQAQNKVFIASFTPNAKRGPRWSGNLKQYQLGVDVNGSIKLVDVNGADALNQVTGVVTDCAVSNWTTSSGNYFEGLGVLNPEVGQCDASDELFTSDLPDGPHVAKGGAAQQIRGQATSRVSDRNLWVLGAGRTTSGDITGDGSALASYAIPNDDADTNLRNYLEGENAGLKGGDRWSTDDGTRLDQGTYFIAEAALDPEPMPADGLRPGIHGDVVHSQPVSITYSASSVKLFYGANDGLYRMVDAETGQEDWGFIAYEHLDKVERLYENSPSIRYSNTGASISSDVQDDLKDYFMDGVTGSYITYSASGAIANAYIYPTMRRGGNWIYALDVSPDANGEPPANPTPLWKYELTGQSWGRPVIGRVNGYADPVLLVGGGYDSCLDPAPGTTAVLYSDLCNAGVTGTQIVVLDALTGAELRVFELNDSSCVNNGSCKSGGGPVVADIAPVDLDTATVPIWDFAYAVDAKGGVYRVNFASITGGAIVPATLTSGWTVDRIAEVSSAGSTKLRFFNRPSVSAFVNVTGNKHVFVITGAGDRERPMELDYPYSDSDVGVKYAMYAVLDRLFDWDHDGDDAVDAPLGRGAVIIPDSSGDIQCSPSTSLPCNGFLNVTSALNAATPITPAGDIYQYHGWFLELPGRGEQVPNPALVKRDNVVFNSYQPGGQAGQCASYGQAKGYNVPLFEPNQAFDSSFLVSGIIPPPPTAETVCIDGQCYDVCFYCGGGSGAGVFKPGNNYTSQFIGSGGGDIQRGYQVKVGPDK